MSEDSSKDVLAEEVLVETDSSIAFVGKVVNDFKIFENY